MKLIIHVIVQVYTKHGVSWSHLYYRFTVILADKITKQLLKKDHIFAPTLLGFILYFHGVSKLCIRTMEEPSKY